MKAIELLKEDREFCNDKSIIEQYDEAIKELKLLSKRSCDNCKSNLKCDIQSCIVEGAKKIDLRLYASDFLSVFSCNNWKPKNTML